MKSWLCSLGCVVAIAALSLAGESVVAKPSGGPRVGHSSCGGTPVPNTYCNFDTTGDGVVIGHDSCKIEGSCTTLGNGARIGNGSCNGEEACSHVGELGGSAIVGNDSCNGPLACQFAGSEGDSVIGDHSCNVDVDVGALACVAAGAGDGPSRGSSRIGNNSCNDDFTCVAVGALEGGSSVIGNNSCNGPGACDFVGQEGFVCADEECTSFETPPGSSVIGNDSCNDHDACFDAGQGGTNRIGNNSCNGSFSCIYAGVVFRDSSIGNHSCNYDAIDEGDHFVGACVENDGTIGNNKNNAP
jgi:hypothetical protein